MGSVNLVDKFFVLSTVADRPETLAAAQKGPVPVIAYGNFINVVLDFTIVAFCIFMIVKGANALRRIGTKEPEIVADPEPTEKECPYCLTKIPIKATRCGHCTSHLTEMPDDVPEGLA